MKTYYSRHDSSGSVRSVGGNRRRLSRVRDLAARGRCLGRRSFDVQKTQAPVERSPQVRTGTIRFAVTIYRRTDGFLKRFFFFFNLPSSRADSVTWNPHKMLTAPQQCSTFLTRHERVLTDSNSSCAQYLFQKDKFYDTTYDTGDKHIQCGRRADVFKFWFMWKAKVRPKNS